MRDNTTITTRLSEQHPREQGLKPQLALTVIGLSAYLSEQHPREQGLKPEIPDIDGEVAASSFRATSKRTRIETQYR